MVVNSHLLVSANAGKVTGLAPTTSGPLTGQYSIIGKVLATGSRASQNGKSDYFAGTTTGKYVIVQIDCANASVL